jgi:hypothetical protein
MKRDTMRSWVEPRLARATSPQRTLQIGLLLVVLALGALVHRGITYPTHAMLLDVERTSHDGDDEEDSDTAAAGSLLLVVGVFLIVVGVKPS